MVWPPIYSASLTFAGCPLQLYLLRMFCSSAHRNISFRTWFFQMFFNKSLIKCEKSVSCLMQHSKKYWKWPEIYKLILHSYWTPQFQNFAIPPTWLSSHFITQRYCYPCIAFSLHNFKLLPICQSEFLGLVILFFCCCFFVFLRFLRNYVSIIVNIVSNNSVLQCYLLWIFVSIRRLLQLIVCIGISTPPHSTGCYCFVFSVSEETKFEVDTTSIILSYLCHFGNVNKELFRYC